MINFLEIFQHLLPYSKAFQLTINKKLKDFIQGLSFLPNEIINYFDLIFLDIFPASTRQLDEWENQFGLFTYNNLTTQQRRDRLDAYWKDKRGQSPRYIQDILQLNGFDVYIHEWWQNGTEANINIKKCVIPRNPTDYLSVDGLIRYSIQCGEPLSQCGEPLSQCGELLTKAGFSLVNKVFVSSLTQNQCNESFMQCGEFNAQCAELGYYQLFKKYNIPLDSKKFPYFMYIGGKNFGDFAIIETSRQEEFERLCLQICPTHLWIGMLIKYN